MEDVLTERELDEYLKKVVDLYKKGLETLKKESESLSKISQKLPKKFQDEENFDDAIIIASEGKHKAIELLRNSLTLYTNIESDLEYIEAQILIYKADDILKDKFDKITDILRKSLVASKKEIRQINKLKGELKALNITSEKLVRAFEGDEFNHRGFFNLKNKIKGL